MNRKNDYIRKYLGVDAWHDAGYTGKRGLTLTAEQDKDISFGAHGFYTRKAFLEIAPDREVRYQDFYGSTGGMAKFCAEVEASGADTMYMSLSGPQQSTERKVLEERLSPYMTFFASAGNYDAEDYNGRIQASNIYGVGAAELWGKGYVNDVQATEDRPILIVENYSSESEHVDFTSITDLYMDDNTSYRFGGTSCACPVLCGMAAVVNDFFIDKTGKPLTSEMMYQFLKDCSEDIYKPDKDVKTGWGVPRLPPPETVDIARYQPDYRMEDSTLQIIEPGYAWNGELEKRTSTKYIILHHAAASEASAEDIHRVHLGNGWIGIGYSYYVRKDGTIYRGRPEDCIGAHTYDYNDISIGVCFEGNFETDTMSGAQYNAGVALLRDILSRYPDLLIRGHRDFDATACPGSNFPMEPMKEDAERVEEGMTYEQFKAYMAQYEQEQRDEPVSAYAAEAWAKAQEKGLMDGTMPRRPLLREQYALILDRMGALD